MAHARNRFVHFVAGKLAAFAGLRALRHLDLQLVGIHQVVGGHAEARRGHLLDGTAPHRVARKRASSSPPSPVFERPPMRFMAMARVSCASLRDGAERHRAGGEALDDFAGRFHLLERHRVVARLISSSPRSVQSWRACLSIRSVYSWKVWKLFCWTACCSLEMVCGL